MSTLIGNIGQNFPLLSRLSQSFFSLFIPIRHYLNDDTYIYDIEKNDVLFMRWKEHFLGMILALSKKDAVPDHRIRTISGASFAGFYYIAFQKSTGNISGLYYHANSEWFQKLVLHHVPATTFGGDFCAFVIYFSI